MRFFYPGVFQMKEHVLLNQERAGRCWVSPDTAAAGQMGTWTFTYETGSYGIEDSGAIRLAWRMVSDWEVPQFDSPENPSVMENLLLALGATPVKYPMRNECCGAYASLKDKNLVQKRSEAIIESAKQAGAEEIVTACPLCLYNLKKCGGIKVTYVTELLAEALGVKDDEQ